MSAIAWIRERAQQAYQTENVLSAEHATDEYPAGTRYRETGFSFRGFVPHRMMRELRAAKLERTDLVTEQISFGTYRSTANRCTYTRAEIEVIGLAETSASSTELRAPFSPGC